MSNMSYCRFHNTAIDLQDCVDVLREEGEEHLDKWEKASFEQIKELAQEIIDNY